MILFKLLFFTHFLGAQVTGFNSVHCFYEEVKPDEWILVFSYYDQNKFKLNNNEKRTLIDISWNNKSTQIQKQTALCGQIAGTQEKDKVVVSSYCHRAEQFYSVIGEDCLWDGDNLVEVSKVSSTLKQGESLTHKVSTESQKGTHYKTLVYLPTDDEMKTMTHDSAFDFCEAEAN